jgi:hypothetical protein
VKRAGTASMEFEGVQCPAMEKANGRAF